MKFGKISSQLDIDDTVNFYPLVIATSTFVHLFTLAGPILLSLFFDLVIPNKSFSTAISLVVGAAIILLFDTVLRRSRAQILEDSCKKYNSKIDLAADKLAKSIYHSVSSVSKSVQNLHKIPQHIDAICALKRITYTIPVLDIVFSVLYLLVIFLIGGRMVLISLALIVVTLAYAYYLSKQQFKLEQSNQQYASERRMIQAEEKNQIEQLILNDWAADTRYKQDAEEQYWSGLSDLRLLSNKYSSFIVAVTQVHMILVLLLGFNLINDHIMTGGSLFALLILSGRMLSSFGGAFNIFCTKKRAQVAQVQLNEDLQNQKIQDALENKVEVKALHNAIELIHVSLFYDEKPALIDINCSIDITKKTAVYGPSGSGKSSLVRLLSGLVEQSAGTILFDGMANSAISKQSLRKHIKTTLQYPQLFSGTVFSNLTSPNFNLSDDELTVLLKQFEFCNFITQSAAGVHMPVARGGLNLAAGHRQIISLVRAMVTNPSFIMFDEPTNGLHQEAKTEFINWVKSNNDTGMLIVTHDMDLLKVMDSAISLVNGKIHAHEKV